MIQRIRGITLIKDVMAGGEKMIVTDSLLMEAIRTLRGAPITRGLTGMDTILLNEL